MVCGMGLSDMQQKNNDSSTVKRTSPLNCLEQCPYSMIVSNFNCTLKWLTSEIRLSNTFFMFQLEPVSQTPRINVSLSPCCLSPHCDLRMSTTQIRDNIGFEVITTFPSNVEDKGNMNRLREVKVLGKCLFSTTVHVLSRASSPCESQCCRKFVGF